MAATFKNTFSENPILAWAIDDWETLRDAVNRSGRNFDDVVKDYKEGAFDDSISKLFDSGQFKLNLGGDTEKTKLIKTDKPMGVFDFSLASKGLYKVIEYYSEKLAKDYPDRFIELELPSGIVPPDLIKQKIVDGEKVFYFEDANGVFDCEIRQKGETAILNGVKGAKKKFATRTKKVYLTYKRNKGKVKYVEIYSLFYYDNLYGDLQYAIRHIPAMMVADYLENIGVKVRFYMTRFVRLDDYDLTLKPRDANGNALPMYDKATRKTNRLNLFLQPIIAKDFLEEFDKPLALSISSRNFDTIYEASAEFALSNELVQSRGYYGTPGFSQNVYFEGLERYRNKYQEYVKLGIFKSKEVLPEAMLFFHDMVIRNHLSNFLSKLIDGNYKGLPNEEADILISPYVNPFFYFWMKVSAGCLRDKIDLINSNELKKDLAAIERVLQTYLDDLSFLIENIPDNITEGKVGGKQLKQFISEWGYKILEKYEIIDYNRKITFILYIQNITDEITTYADGLYYGSSKETIEKRDALAETILEELLNF